MSCNLTAEHNTWAERECAAFHLFVYNLQFEAAPCSCSHQILIILCWANVWPNREKNTRITTLKVHKIEHCLVGWHHLTQWLHAKILPKKKTYHKQISICVQIWERVKIPVTVTNRLITRKSVRIKTKVCLLKMKHLKLVDVVRPMYWIEETKKTRSHWIQ